MTTITITPPTAARTFARIAALAGTVALRVVNVVRAYLNRRDIQVLAGLDDRMLADIGLTKGDVRDAVAEPLWRDPTNLLVNRVHERRQWRGSRGDEGGFRLVEAPSMIPHLEMGLRAGKLSQLSPRYH